MATKARSTQHSSTLLEAPTILQLFNDDGSINKVGEAAPAFYLECPGAEFSHQQPFDDFDDL